MYVFVFVCVKLTGSQLVKKFPAIYETTRFIAAFTRARYRCLFWTISIQFMSPILLEGPFYYYHHTCLSLPSGLFPSVFPTKNPGCTSVLPYMCYMLSPSHCSWFDHPRNVCWAVQIIKLLVLYFSRLHCYLVSLLGPNIPLNTPFSNALSLRSLLNVSDQVSHPYKTTDKIIVVHILIFIFSDSKLDHKIFRTEWQQVRG